MVNHDRSQDKVSFMININITIPLINNKIKRIKSKSRYNVNYYVLENYGDIVNFMGNNILLEECDECYNSYTYSIGSFEDFNDKFISVITFSSDKDLLENIKIEDI